MRHIPMLCLLIVPGISPWASDTIAPVTAAATDAPWVDFLPLVLALIGIGGLLLIRRYASHI
ncbi:MAG: hypothetical protein H6993_03800 [Pseudomonadales bacterium]|nr:hypothetical protein [Pseudomonadales bacterium]MCP5183058.1 hypothetical protein [Pseudomonadales bacterium]